MDLFGLSAASVCVCRGERSGTVSVGVRGKIGEALLCTEGKVIVLVSNHSCRSSTDVLHP